MKKTILAVTTAALSLTTMAATTNTISTSTKSGLNKFLSSTKASVYMNASKSNIDTDVTEHTQYLILKNKIGSDFSSRLEIRTNTTDVAGADGKGNDMRMIDPRLTLYGFASTIKTSAGDISISPALRTEIAVNDNSEEKYGRLRLGVTASMNTNAANNIGVFAGTYETIAKSNASRATTEASNLYIYAWDEYSINDKHSVTAFYESFRGLNQDTLTLNQKYSETDISFYYNNKTIKNLALSPYVLYNTSNTLAADQVTLAIDATYSF